MNMQYYISNATIMKLFYFIKSKFLRKNVHLKHVISLTSQKLKRT